jgi:hypothetical protein
MKLLVLFFFILSLNASADNLVHSLKDVSDIKFELLSGDVQVNSSGSDKVEVTLTKEKYSKNCDVKAENSLGTFSLKVFKKSYSSENDCVVRVNLLVPDKVKLELKNGSGNLNLNTAKIDLEYRLGSGDVYIAADLLSLDGKSGSGSFMGLGNIGDTKIDNGSGNLEINYKKELDGKEISINVGSGDVIVRFPKDTKINSDISVGSGKRSNHFEKMSSINNRIKVRIGSGNLEISPLLNEN